MLPASALALSTALLTAKAVNKIQKIQVVTNPPNSQTNPSFEYTAEVVFGGIVALFATIIIIY